MTNKCNSIILLIVVLNIINTIHCDICFEYDHTGYDCGRNPDSANPIRYKKRNCPNDDTPADFKHKYISRRAGFFYNNYSKFHIETIDEFLSYCSSGRNCPKINLSSVINNFYLLFGDNGYFEIKYLKSLSTEESSIAFYTFNTTSGVVSDEEYYLWNQLPTIYRSWCMARGDTLKVGEIPGGTGVGFVMNGKYASNPIGKYSDYERLLAIVVSYTTDKITNTQNWIIGIKVDGNSFVNWNENTYFFLISFKKAKFFSNFEHPHYLEYYNCNPKSVAFMPVVRRCYQYAIMQPIDGSYDKKFMIPYGWSIAIHDSDLIDMIQDFGSDFLSRINYDHEKFCFLILTRSGLVHGIDLDGLLCSKNDFSYTLNDFGNCVSTSSNARFLLKKNDPLPYCYPGLTPGGTNNQLIESKTKAELRSRIVPNSFSFLLNSNKALMSSAYVFPLNQKDFNLAVVYVFDLNLLTFSENLNKLIRSLSNVYSPISKSVRSAAFYYYYDTSAKKCQLVEDPKTKSFQDIYTTAKYMRRYLLSIGHNLLDFASGECSASCLRQIVRKVSFDKIISSHTNRDRINVINVISNNMQTSTTEIDLLKNDLSNKNIVINLISDNTVPKDIHQTYASLLPYAFAKNFDNTYDWRYLFSKKFLFEELVNSIESRNIVLSNKFPIVVEKNVKMETFPYPVHSIQVYVNKNFFSQFSNGIITTVVYGYGIIEHRLYEFLSPIVLPKRVNFVYYGSKVKLDFVHFDPQGYPITSSIPNFYSGRFYDGKLYALDDIEDTETPFVNDKFDLQKSLIYEALETSIVNSIQVNFNPINTPTIIPVLVLPILDVIHLTDIHLTFSSAQIDYHLNVIDISKYISVCSVYSVYCQFLSLAFISTNTYLLDSKENPVSLSRHYIYPFKFYCNSHLHKPGVYTSVFILNDPIKTSRQSFIITIT